MTRSRENTQTMSRQKNLYTNKDWFEFSQRVRARDGYKCLKCHRPSTDVVLQVHHEIYIPNRRPWEYALSDCTTLCKGCHAREHGHIEPDSGWELLSIDDLGALTGVCERDGCGSEIRYEHLAYHPLGGYKIIGSTCIEFLTEADIHLSGNILKQYKNISKFVHDSDWYHGLTRNGKIYTEAKYNHNLIRIYGSEGKYAFQIAIKEKGVRLHHYEKTVSLPGKKLDEVKELAYIALKGTMAEDGEEKAMLRNLYKSIK